MLPSAPRRPAAKRASHSAHLGIRATPSQLRTHGLHPRNTPARLEPTTGQAEQLGALSAMRQPASIGSFRRPLSCGAAPRGLAHPSWLGRGGATQHKTQASVLRVSKASPLGFEPRLVLGSNRRVVATGDVPAERSAKECALADALGRAATPEVLRVVETFDCAHGRILIRPTSRPRQSARETPSGPGRAETRVGWERKPGAARTPSLPCWQ